MPDHGRLGLSGRAAWRLAVSCWAVSLIGFLVVGSVTARAQTEEPGSLDALLATYEVSSSRFTVMGYGESQPMVSNETAAGRQANRRVDLAIMANDKLKQAAEEKAEQSEG